MECEGGFLANSRVSRIQNPSIRMIMYCLSIFTFTLDNIGPSLSPLHQPQPQKEKRAGSEIKFDEQTNAEWTRGEQQTLIIVVITSQDGTNFTNDIDFVN